MSTKFFRLNYTAFAFLSASVICTAFNIAGMLLTLLVFVPSDRGAFVLASTAASILAASLDLGIGVSSSRYYADDNDKRAVLGTLHGSVIFRAGIIFITTVSLAALPDSLPFGLTSPQTSIAVLGAIPLMVFSSYLPLKLHAASVSQYNALLIAQAVTPFSVISSLFILGVTSVTTYLLVILLSNSTLACISIGSVPGAFRTLPKFDRKWLVTLVSGYPIGMTFFLNLAIARGWYFWLARYYGLDIVGTISVAQSIAERLTLVGDSYGQALFRRIVSKDASNVSWEIKKYSVEPLFLIGLITAGIILFSSYFLAFLPGDYAAVGGMLNVIIWAYVFQAYFRVIHHALLGMGYSRYSFLSYLGSAVCLIVGLTLLDHSASVFYALSIFSVSNVALLIIGALLYRSVRK